MGLLLVWLFLLAVVFFGCSKNETSLRNGFESGRYRTIVAFGDSIVEGFGQPEGWPEILGRDLSVRFEGVHIFNAGRSGDTAADGLARIGKDVLDREPDLVLISFGLNDMKNTVSLSQFDSDLSAIILGVSAAGAQPVLMTTTRLQKGAGLLARLNPAPYNDSIRTLAKGKGVPLVDVNDRFKGYNTAEYLMDGAHPNAAGYKVLADIIREGLIGE